MQSLGGRWSTHYPPTGNRWSWPLSPLKATVIVSNGIFGVPPSLQSITVTKVVTEAFSSENDDEDDNNSNKSEGKNWRIS